MSKSLYHREVEKSSFKAWDQDPLKPLPISDIIKMYENGFAGSICSEEAEEELLSKVEMPYGDDVARIFGFEEAGKNQLVFPLEYVIQAYPNSFPGIPQVRGSCVGDSAALTARCRMVIEAVSNKADEVSGKLETLPEVSLEAEKNNVLAFEPIYWHRGHSGDGWDCGSATSTLLEKCGAVLRKKYDSINIDLTKYDGNLAGRWGRTPPPKDIQEVFNKNLFRTATKVRTAEEARDFLSLGFFILTCGSQGWENARDENGFSRRKGTWQHALMAGSFDDRPETKQKYGEPLVLVCNTWGAYNKDSQGKRKILGTNKYIPDGTFWAKWSDFANRQMFAIAGLNGWVRKELPDLSPGAV